MSLKQYAVPAKDNEFLCHPPKNTILEIVSKNKQIIDKWNFDINGIPFKEFRNQTRLEALNLSNSYDLRLKKTVNSHIKYSPDSNSHEDTIIATGHQPDFSHPGIMIKYLLLSSIANKYNFKGVDLIVDTDNCKNVSISLPNFTGKNSLKNIPLLSKTKPTPFEFTPVPEKSSYDHFINEIENNLNHTKLKNIKNNFIKWKNSVKDLDIKNYNYISDLLISLRHSFENETNTKYSGLPVSHLTETFNFTNFFTYIVFNHKKFFRIYNQKLQDYRIKHKMRYDANPFPDLEIKNELYELPFWIIIEGERKPVYIKRSNDKFSLYSEDKPILHLDSLNSLESTDLLLKNSIKIRPKALMLTMFSRMFFSDLFIHGVGGAKYDSITDEIILDFFNVLPPKYLTVSYTKFLNIDCHDQTKQIKELEKNIRDIRYNPDRYIDNNKNHLVTKKQSLLKQFQTPSSNKKELGIKVKNINKKMLAHLTNKISGMNNELLSLKEKQSKFLLTKKRDYPFFLYNKEDFIF